MTIERGGENYSMKAILLFFCLVYSFFNIAQLNCKVNKGIKGDSTVCFHQNGTVSSISFSSIQHERYYHFLAFDNKGNKVLEANHGLLHGSAGLDVKYYPNGAIRSARKTFQPDGGIQYYDVTSFFKEDGTFDHEEDNSWDKQITVITQPYERTPEKVEQKIEPVSVVIKNTTSRKLKILVGEVVTQKTKWIVTVKKNKEIEIGQFVPKNKKDQALQFYQFEVLPMKKKFKTVIFTSNDLNTDKRQVLLVVEKDE